MTHSPDHAERARVEAIIRNEVGDACYDDVRWLSNREVTERCVAAALRGRDALLIEIADAIPDDLTLFRAIRDAKARSYGAAAKAVHALLTPLEGAIRFKASRAALHDAKEAGE